MPSNRTEALHAIRPNPLQRCAPLSSYITASRQGSASLPWDEQLPICPRDSFAVSRRVLRYYRAFCTRVHGLGGVSIGRAGSEVSYGRESERSDGRMRAREGQRVHSLEVGRRCGFETKESARSSLNGRIAAYLDFEYRGGYEYVVPPLQICARWVMRSVSVFMVLIHLSSGAATSILEKAYPRSYGEGSCVRDVPRTRAVHPAAVLARLRGGLRGVTSNLARDGHVCTRGK
ncbi:hypothetical protein FB451DRAFT_1181185 [Mycena latifolia]|nr:hypothetical protein FB451DRAFT_1181185 [Mycena latifolia]